MLRCVFLSDICFAGVNALLEYNYVWFITTKEAMGLASLLACTL